MKTKLLIVEDDSEISRVMRDMFHSEGYDVTLSTTGFEGWEDFKNDKYDLVLIDLMLPEMDGFTLCKNIRWKSNIPIIIISAKKDDSDKIKGLELGADDYISKPFSLDELLARVESHLRRWKRYKGIKTSENTTSYLNDLKIYWDAHRVELEGVEINLTVKETELLYVLAKNQERVFTKSELYSHVWKQLDADGLHTVTVHIKSLREKLNDPVKEPRFIKTVWGKGYHFIGECL